MLAEKYKISTAEISEKPRRTGEKYNIIGPDIITSEETQVATNGAQLVLQLGCLVLKGEI